LYGQGSTVLFGGKLPRSLLTLDPEAVIRELKTVAFEKAKGADLLRIYWYDTIGFKGPTSDQTSLARLDDIKFRVALANQPGEQHWVDSLITADLVELARLKSICDAVLLSGDEGLRIGIQIAQSHGIRVHLIAIQPTKLQSRVPLQEGDTTTEWNQHVIERILSARPSGTVTATLAPSPGSISVTIADLDPRIEKVALDLVATMDEGEIKAVHTFLDTAGRVPPEFDGKLLGLCRDELGRDLTIRERRHARAQFSTAVKTRGKAF
jgi:NYN domain-containing protein